MDWILVNIYTTNEGIDFVCDALSEIGYDNVEIEDNDDFKTFLEENKKYWDYVDDELLKEKDKETRVKIYIENNEGLTGELSKVSEKLKELKNSDENNLWGSLRVETDSIKEDDWANNWKNYFHPLKVGKKVLIQPEWEKINNETDRIVFTVNPGMTFGTGTHHTTKLCIEYLENVIGENSSVLDLGCGSGILSVISLLLGAKDVVSVDIDPMCEKVCMENAELNCVDKEKLKVYIGDVTTDKELFSALSEKKYDVIVANIVADVIIAILPTVKKLIAKNSTFICSGIIDDRLQDVINAMEKEEINYKTITKSDCWNAILCEF